MSPSAHDFLLEATPAILGSGVRIVLTSLSTGKALGETVVPALDRRRLERDYLRPLQAHVEQKVDPARLKALGQELAAFLLPASLLTPLCAELLRHPDPTAPIYLRLATTDASLEALPWEYLYLETTPLLQATPGFICLNPRVHLIRRSVTPTAIGPLPIETLRLLVVWANPGSPAYPALACVEQEAEGVMALLKEAPECRRIEARVLPHATPSGLEKDLNSWQPHVLHFVGHGDTRQGEGRLILEGERIGTDQEVSAQALQGWLSYPDFRLLTLSACRTAALGAMLTRNGIPGVVAMQLPWRDKLAVVFGRTFYSALVASEPLEEALCQARQSLSGAGGDWGIPALFLAGDSSRLLDFRPLPPPPPPPNNLSYPSNSDFVGRESVMERIRDLLRSPEGRPVALVGLGGIGKTQLAVQYAQHFLEEYPGGVFWLEANDTASVRAGYAGLIRFFPVPEDNNDHPTDWVRDRLQQATAPTLLIFNNLTGRTDLSLLPSVGCCRILATTREGYLAYPRFHRVDVMPLDTAAALKLLQTRQVAESAEEQAAAHAIVARIGCMPLALALVAHHVQNHVSFAEYLERLTADPLETLTQARKRFINLTGHDGSLFDTLNLSYLELDAAAAHLLQTASCFASQKISLDLLQEASGIAKRSAFFDALADLKAYTLIDPDTDQGVRLHELVRDFALDQAGTHRAAHIQRVARLLTQRLRTANKEFNWERARLEIDHCRAVAELCERYEVEDDLCDLLFAIGGYLFEHADLETATHYHTRCLQLSRVRYGVRSERTARFTMYLALTLLHKGDLPAALEMGRAALTIAESLWESNAEELADFCNDMGYILKRAGQLEAAVTHYGRALFLCPRNNHITRASIVNNIGALHEALGNLPAARACIMQALESDQEHLEANHPKIAIRLNNIGRVTNALGNAAEALALHQRAMAINLATYEARHPDVAACHFYIGQAEEKLGRRLEARDRYELALEIYVQFYGSEHRVTCIVRDSLAKLDARNEV